MERLSWRRGPPVPGRRSPRAGLHAGMVGLFLILVFPRPVAATTLALPSDTGAPPGGSVIVALSAGDADGILGLDVVIATDPAVARVIAVERTPLSIGHELVINLSPPGLVRISLYGTLPLGGDGALLALTLEATGPAGSSTTLDLVFAEANEGALPISLIDGLFCVGERPTEVTGLSLQHAATPDVAVLDWIPQAPTLAYNLYRAAGAGLTDLACLSAELPGPPASDEGLIPPPGRALYYLVTSVACGGESTLGYSSSGTERANPAPCPLIPGPGP